MASLRAAARPPIPASTAPRGNSGTAQGKRDEAARHRAAEGADVVIVILAAGAAQRMGRQKLLLPIDGRPMIEHVLAAAAGWPVVIVSGDELAPELGATSLCVVRNGSPELGMSHSLALANQAIPDREPIGVLLGDVPDISAATIAHVAAAYDESVDIVVPYYGDAPGHPVVFGPAARRMIPVLPDGDTLHRLRDDPALRRRRVDLSQNALRDIDTPADYRARVEGRPGNAQSSR